MKTSPSVVYQPTQDFFKSPLREDIYLLLANLLFQPPDEDIRQVLAEMTWTCGSYPPLQSALRDISSAAAQSCVEELAHEFNMLFIGMGRGEIVPYASWYKEKLLMGQPLAALRKDLSQSGICRGESISEPEDHAAALLETMVLIIRDPHAPVSQQINFFQNHIQPWMHRFFNDLTAAPAAGFYQTVGLAGHSLLQVDAVEMHRKTEKGEVYE